METGEVLPGGCGRLEERFEPALEGYQLNATADHFVNLESV